MATEMEYRRQMIAVCKRIYEKGYVASNDGNLSIKLGNDRFLVTPSGFSKGDLAESDLIICDAKGNKITGKHRVTSEILMHLRAFSVRPDLKAAVHAHPVFATAFALSGISLADCLLPEVILTFGSIPTSDYAQPASQEGADVIEKLIRNYDVLLLDRHGSFTAGKDLWEAYYKLERLEHVAQITYYARMLGPVRRIPGDEMNRLVSRGIRTGMNPETLSRCAYETKSAQQLPPRAPEGKAQGENPEEERIEKIVRDVIQSL